MYVDMPFLAGELPCLHSSKLVLRLAGKAELQQRLF